MRDPSSAKPTPERIWHFGWFLHGVGRPQAARLGETCFAISTVSLLTWVGSSIRTLTHVDQTGPAGAYLLIYESGTSTGTMLVN